MLAHKSESRFHSESPARLDMIRPEIIDAHVNALRHVSVADHGESWVSTVHTEEYVNLIRTAFEQNWTRLFNSPSYVCAGTFEAALVAVSGVITAVDEVFQDRADNGFCAVRPPGHHANQHRSLGFCLFNNVAIAARYLQQRYRRQRVMIVDWDVHPGNGTAEIFYEDPDVFVFSIHQDDLMARAGLANLRGKGAGVGTTFNLPLPARLPAEKYLLRFHREVLEAAERFEPDAVLLSAGFDCHAADPIGGMLLQDNDFALMTEWILMLADTYCEGRLVSVLEGGYSPEVLLRCVVALCQVLKEV